MVQETPALAYLRYAALASLLFTASTHAEYFSSDRDYQRQQHQADKGFADFDREFEQMDDDFERPTKRVEPAPRPAPAPPPVVYVAPAPEAAPEPVEVATPSPTQPEVFETVFQHGFIFELQTCRLNPGRAAKRGLSCEFKITSEDEDRNIRLHGAARYSDRPSRIFDTDGNEYSASRVNLANNNSHQYSISGTLVSGIKTKASTQFDNFPSSVNQLSLVELKGNGLTVQFRDVTIEK